MKDLTELRVGNEVLLANLEAGMTVALEAVAPPEPLYLPGVISQIVLRCVVVRMFPPHGEGIVRLHANVAGRFVTDEDRPVRVFRLEE
jgi:hypothetical protein